MPLPQVNFIHRVYGMHGMRNVHVEKRVYCACAIEKLSVGVPPVSIVPRVLSLASWRFSRGELLASCSPSLQLVSMEAATLVTALGQTLDPNLRQQAEKLLEEVCVLISAHHYRYRQLSWGLWPFLHITDPPL